MLYTIGETVYDIIFEQHIPKKGVVGGAMLNSAISLARLGREVALITEIGQDPLGEKVYQFLQTNRVETQWVQVYETGQTSLSLAFLDADGKARYQFYKKLPPQRLYDKWPLLSSGDILLFGSFFALDAAIRVPLTQWLALCRQSGALLVYDPNFRANHRAELPEYMPFFEAYFAAAHLIKGSNEDFAEILGIDDPIAIHRRMKELQAHHLIITAGAEGVWLFTPGYEQFYPTPSLEVVSTIGAGDTFNAGLVYGLACSGVDQNLKLTSGQWDHIINQAIRFASRVCQSWDNYLDYEFSVNEQG